MGKTVGMYGGKFLPLHMGHVYMMTKASTMVDELHIIVSYDEEYEKKLCKQGGKIKHIPYNVRVRWWRQLTKDLPHVKVHAVEEEQSGEFEDWKHGSEGIKKAIGKPITHIFSSEPSYDEFFKKLYPYAKHVVIDPRRSKYNVSATAIRHEGVIKHWDMLPNVVKPHFVKKVVVVGTESCGKSTLVKNLANLYNTNYVEEFGRTFYERLGDPDTLVEDYPHIAFEHKYHEKKQLENANKVIFIDTEAIVTQYYSLLYNEYFNPVVDSVASIQDYDLWIYLEPDVAWVYDGMRKHGEQDVRQRNNDMLKKLLKDYGIEYETVSGSYEERLNKVIELVDNILY